MGWGSELAFLVTPSPSNGREMPHSASLSHNHTSVHQPPPRDQKPLPTLCLSPPQVVKHLPKAHILACAPSNSGADLLCQRLRVHLPSSIYRLLAPSRDIHLVPEDIKVPREGKRPRDSGCCSGSGN